MFFTLLAPLSTDSYFLIDWLIISKRHYLLHFLVKCLRLYLHNKILNPSRIGFYVWCEVLQLHFFSIWITSLIIIHWSVHPVDTDWQCHLSYMECPCVHVSVIREHSFPLVSWSIIVTMIHSLHAVVLLECAEI